MSFAGGITRAPVAFDPDRGAEALDILPRLPGELAELISGTAGCSPYLARLIASERDWLEEVLAGEPDTAMATLVEAAMEAGTGAELRGLKSRAALLIALADLGGIWDLASVTGALTRFADAAVGTALRLALTPLIARGKLPGLDPDTPPEAAGMIVLAMGKMGAFELNYSSDIDLICLFDDGPFDASDLQEVRAGFVRATRAMAATLSEHTAEGYVFRTDLRLRPDAGVTPVCLSTEAALRYYEAEGRTWERAAYIKARPAAGTLAAGDRFLEALTPFVWRRHLDFAAIHETQEMRRRIRDHKGFGTGISLPGHNVKLGTGGIREIEFFAQTRQLIAGGRDPGLRQRDTVGALSALAGRGWIDESERATLTAHYRALREVEHRLQMVGDAQTQILPNSAEGMDRIARFCGYGDTGAFEYWLRGVMEEVTALSVPFFDPGPRPGQEVLAELSDTARDIVARWPGYPALRSARAREIFARLRPELLSRLEQSARPDEAIAAFDGFLRGLPAGVQIFALFDANPPLVDLIGDICTISPALARYLSQHSAVFDAVIGGDFFSPWPGAEALSRALTGAMPRDDYERALDAARTWQKEWHFRIGVHLLRGLIDPEEAGRQYADLAEAVVAALWPLVQDDIARRHGPPPGAGGAVVAMGSLGAGALNAGSDLDLIVIYDAGIVEMSEGPRPIDARSWYAKATKALIAALSAPTASGILYEVDLRLRPSGRQGPVATAVTAFETYQREEAWTWEHLALTRARCIAGPTDLCGTVERIRREAIATAGQGAEVLANTADMRVRLEAAGRTGGTFDVKTGPGGLQDIELVAQAGALLAKSPERGTEAQLQAAVAAGVIADAAPLWDAATLFQALRHGAALLGPKAPDPETLGAGARAFLARVTDTSDIDALMAKLDSAREVSTDIIAAALPDVQEDRP
ncbi:glutamine-synthetase adenylyltransferase [Rhodobacterales bacterium HKCCE3408]|nr:glutamine-synthetase adenylyltransferase [Rhodobacterales bacterium HKCCE3408]